MATDALTEGPEAVRALVDVSRETLERLEHYVSLLRRWQTVQNLVSRTTLNSVWTRHIADSAQIVPVAERHAPAARRWIDLGSGAGLPGVVVATLLAERVPDAEVHLVESNQRKAAFLRAAVRELGLTATVHAARVEQVAATEPGFDLVTARALAELDQLLVYALPLLAPEGACLFHKGRDVARERDEASRKFDMAVLEIASRTAEDGRLLLVQNVRARD